MIPVRPMIIRWVYNIAADGTITGLIFPNVKVAARSVMLTCPARRIVISDSGGEWCQKNNDFDQFDQENGEFRFVYNHGQAGERQANINDNEMMKLVYYGDDGIPSRWLSVVIIFTTQQNAAAVPA